MPYQITPPMIQALLGNDDTRAFGIDLWKSLATQKTAPIVSNGYVLDGRTGQILYPATRQPGHDRPEGREFAGRRGGQGYWPGDR